MAVPTMPTIFDPNEVETALFATAKEEPEDRAADLRAQRVPIVV